jgi:ABC-2 type transport system permease protein
LRHLLRVARAFLWKDLLEETSYRFTFLFGIAGIVFSLFFLMFIARTFGDQISASMLPYGGNYFAFVVVGLAIYSFLGAALQRLAQIIRQAQVVGTLEALLSTRTSLATIVVCMPMFAFLETSLRVLGYVAIGVLGFGMPLRLDAWPEALVTLALTIAAFGGLGLFVAGLTMAFKRSEPLIASITAASLFLGGVYYPLTVLPHWLQVAAQFFPITPALEASRATLLTGKSWGDILPELLALAVFAGATLPAGAAFFRWTLRRAMRDGTLTQY